MPNNIIVFGKEGSFIALKGKAAGKYLSAVGCQEGGIDNHCLRKYCQPHHKVNHCMSQQILHSPRLFCHHGLQRIHSIGIPVGQETLYKEHDDGQSNNDAADSCRKAVIPSDFSHELIVNEHR